MNNIIKLLGFLNVHNISILANLITLYLTSFLYAVWASASHLKIFLRQVSVEKSRLLTRPKRS